MENITPHQHSQNRSTLVEELYVALRRRADRSRLEGIGCIVIILVVASAIVSYFVGNAPSWSVTVGNNNAAPITVQGGEGVWVPVISALILRIGAVMLSIFVIQILFSLARYRFGVSDSLFVRANALRLSAGDPVALKMIVMSLSTGAIDFSKLEKSPYQELAALVHDAASKVTK